MNAKHLILTLSLTLAAGAAASALTGTSGDPALPVPAAGCDDQAADHAIARVVITAPRHAVDGAIPRIVVIGHRPGPALAAARS